VDRREFERAFGGAEFEFRIGRHVFVGLDATRPGRELELLREALRRTRAMGESLVLVRHYPVLRGSPRAPDPEILEAIRDQDVPLVLTGHGHAPRIDRWGRTLFVVAPATGDRSERQGQTPVSDLLVRWTGSEFRIERHDRMRRNAVDLRAEFEHLLFAHLLPAFPSRE
jgi:hypothetical protein